MKDDDHEALPLSEEPDEGGGTVDGVCVLVPDGKYELRYVDYETATYYGSAKVVLKRHPSPRTLRSGGAGLRELSRQGP